MLIAADVEEGMELSHRYCEKRKHLLFYSNSTTIKVLSEWNQVHANKTEQPTRLTSFSSSLSAPL